VFNYVYIYTYLLHWNKKRSSTLKYINKISDSQALIGNYVSNIPPCIAFPIIKFHAVMTQYRFKFYSRKYLSACTHYTTGESFTKQCRNSKINKPLLIQKHLSGRYWEEHQRYACYSRPHLITGHLTQKLKKKQCLQIQHLFFKGQCNLFYMEKGTMTSSH
jgi:hypothetical protein